jgi:hypothetical protein
MVIVQILFRGLIHGFKYIVNGDVACGDLGVHNLRRPSQPTSNDLSVLCWEVLNML